MQSKKLKFVNSTLMVIYDSILAACIRFPKQFHQSRISSLLGRQL